MSTDHDMSSSQPALHAVYPAQTPTPPVSEILIIIAGTTIAILGLIGASSTAPHVGPGEIFLGSVAGVVTGIATTMSAVVLRRLRQLGDVQREQRGHFDERLTHSRRRQEALAEQLLDLLGVERGLLDEVGEQRRRNGR